MATTRTSNNQHDNNETTGKGDTVVFSCPDNEETARCGKVVRAWRDFCGFRFFEVEASGESFTGPAAEFQKVNRFKAA